jgi:sugar lactone lactonase YvrE
MKSAAVLAVLIAAAVASPHGDGRARPAYPLPGTFATLRVADGLGAVSGGAGDAWVDDRWSQHVLRIDHRTGRVTARIPVRGRVALAEDAGAVWIAQSGGEYGRGLRGPLMRVDPATNRVTARIPLRDLGFGLEPDGDDLWVWGPRNLVRVDARASVAVQAILVGGDRGETTGFALLGGAPVLTTADGHLVRYDRRTGDEVASIELPFTAPALQTASAERLIVVTGGEVAALDPTGRTVLWRKRLGFRVGTVVEDDGALWAYGADVRDAGDRVWKLDPETGRTLGSVLLPAFSTMGMAVIDGTVWVTTAGGRVLVLRRS